MRWCSCGSARRPVSLRTLSRRVRVHSMMTVWWVGEGHSGRSRVTNSQSARVRVRERGRKGPGGRTVEREDRASERVEVRPVDDLAHEREHEREKVEHDVVLGVLLQCLDACALDGPAAEPHGAFDNNGADHGGERNGWDVRLFEVRVEETLGGLDEDLEERRDHEDGEDENAERLHPGEGVREWDQPLGTLSESRTAAVRRATAHRCLPAG